MIEATVAAAVLCAALFVGRVLFALQLCMRANNALAAYLRSEIYANRCDIARVNALYDRLAATSHFALALDVTVWTTEDAFPWLFELVRQQKGATA